MTTTRDNPGAFRAVAPLGVRAVLKKAARFAGQGDWRSASLTAVADGANLVAALLARRSPGRLRCPCCGHESWAFRHVVAGGRITWNSACPGCDSRSRHRGLAALLPGLLDRHAPRSALHFAPEPVLRSHFARRDLRYETADLHLEDATHRGVDVQELPFPDGCYDMILCNHVLEHVADDRKAVRELARVLSTGGVAIITVPGDFTRQHTVVFEGTRPNGHYRDYGLDIEVLLGEAFRRVEVVDMHTLNPSPPRLSYAIRPMDIAFICRNPAVRSARQ